MLLSALWYGSFWSSALPFWWLLAQGLRFLLFSRVSVSYVGSPVLFIIYNAALLFGRFLVLLVH